ncbi:hypothetical protein [Arsenicicoccus dermatophilus]|uniref:hypothetical protein n=1 Tax=Arsenicicoccus dermatophilus TaxID=1076331 RepID=UPI001F4D18CA|nr:hypothetical protein [Arsenicicoccus dermatophilus]MCH8613471.1 hypothetical protein [Arsenicicoccus dermatophilus]
MADPTHDDFVLVYDVRTGDKLENPVPRHWLEQPFAAHLKPVPSNGRFAKPNPDAAPALTDDPTAAAAVVGAATSPAVTPDPTTDTHTQEA